MASQNSQGYHAYLAATRSESENRRIARQKAVMLTLLRLSVLFTTIYTVFHYFQSSPTLGERFVDDEEEDTSNLSDEEAERLLRLHLASYDTLAHTRKDATAISWWPFLGELCSIIYTIAWWAVCFFAAVVVIIPGAWVLNNLFWPENWRGHLAQFPHRYLLVLQWFAQGMRLGSSKLYELSAKIVSELLIKLTIDLINATVFLWTLVVVLLWPIHDALNRIFASISRRRQAILNSDRLAFGRRYMQRVQHSALGWFIEAMLLFAFVSCIIQAYKGVDRVFNGSMAVVTPLKPTRTWRLLPTRVADPWLAPPSYSIDEDNVLRAGDPVLEDDLWPATSITIELSFADDEPSSVPESSFSTVSPPPVTRETVTQTVVSNITSVLRPITSRLEAALHEPSAVDSSDPLVGLDIEDLTLAEIAELSGPMHLVPTGVYIKTLLAEDEKAFCDLCKQHHGAEVLTAQKDFLYEWQMGR